MSPHRPRALAPRSGSAPDAEPHANGSNGSGGGHWNGSSQPGSTGPGAVPRNAPTSDESPTPSPARGASGRLLQQQAALAAPPAALPPQPASGADDPNDLAAMNARLAAGLALLPPALDLCRSGSAASGASLDFSGATTAARRAASDRAAAGDASRKRQACAERAAYGSGGSGSDSEGLSGPLAATRRAVKGQRIDVGMSGTGEPGRATAAAAGAEDDEGTSTRHVGSVRTCRLQAASAARRLLAARAHSTGC